MRRCCIIGGDTSLRLAGAHRVTEVTQPIRKADLLHHELASLQLCLDVLRHHAGLLHSSLELFFGATELRDQ